MLSGHKCEGAYEIDRHYDRVTLYVAFPLYDRDMNSPLFFHLYIIMIYGVCVNFVLYLIVSDNLTSNDVTCQWLAL